VRTNPGLSSPDSGLSGNIPDIDGEKDVGIITFSTGQDNRARKGSENRPEPALLPAQDR
jgi:hypothetical protein